MKRAMRMRRMRLLPRGNPPMEQESQRGQSMKAAQG
jgi:predicted nuclease with RNAse H fold